MIVSCNFKFPLLVFFCQPEVLDSASVLFSYIDLGQSQLADKCENFVFIICQIFVVRFNIFSLYKLFKCSSYRDQMVFLSP